MPLLPIIVNSPPAWELFIPPVASTDSALVWPVPVDGSSLPVALLRPLAPLLGLADAPAGENFLSGLRAEKVLGAATLPAAKLRRAPMVWVGLALQEAGRLFENLQAGCWVCGFPTVGRGRELLRSGNLADTSGFQSALVELGLSAPVGPHLYFNFHYDEPQSTCDRVYVLDAVAGSLHGFAFSRSALAPANLK